MEIASGKWLSHLSELEMVDPVFFQQYQMMNTMDYSFDVDDHLNFQYSLSSAESYSSDPNIIHQKISPAPAFNNINASCIEAIEDFKVRPMKQLKTNSWNSCITENNNNIIILPPKASSSPSSRIISFENTNISCSAIPQQYYGLDCVVKPKNEGQVSKRVGSLTRTPLHAQDHVIAERKRREKQNQRLISLSKLIPGLKKTDKASILGEAIKYVKQLQEQVTTLEEQHAKKTVESVIFVKKTEIYTDDKTSSSDENFDSHSNKPLPEIEARVSEKDVLIKIHCEKINKGCMSNIINEVENLHLSVLSSNVLPFGHTRDITIVAQMEAVFSMTVKDLVKSLRRAFLKFI